MILDREDGTVLARSQATFVGAPEAKKDELKARYGFALAPDVSATPEMVDAPTMAGRA